MCMCKSSEILCMRGMLVLQGIRIIIVDSCFIRFYFRILACPSGTYNEGKGLNCTGKSFSLYKPALLFWLLKLRRDVLVAMAINTKRHLLCL